MPGYPLIHVIHAAVAVAAAALLVLLRGFGDQGVAGQQQRRDAGRVLQGGAGDLGRVDDAGLDQVFVLVGRGVVAVVAFAFGDLLADDAAVLAGVVGDLRSAARGRRGRRCCSRPPRPAQSPSGLTVAAGPQQGDAAAGEDAFFDGRAGGVQGVFDAGLLLLHLALGRGADVDLGHAAGELRQPLFELLAVVVAGGVLDLAADLVDAALDVGALAGAFDDRRVVLVDDDLLGPAELGERRRFRA